MSNLAEFLVDPSATVDQPNDDKLIAPWLQRAASDSTDWEARARKNLETSAFARDFKRAFPGDHFGGVYKVDAKTGVKTLTKPADQVIQEAYEWLSKKFKGNARKAREVLDATGLVDEYVTSIMFCFGEDALEKADKETEKNREFDERQPAYALEEDRDSETTAESVIEDSLLDRIDAKPTTKKAGLQRSKRIEDYGIVASESELQLWKTGKLLASISVEDMGGFHIVADEVEGLTTKEDVEALFSVANFAPEVKNETSKVGLLVVFASGANKLSGKVVAEEDGSASVIVDDMDGVEVNVPVDSLKFASNECCVEQMKEGTGKFCRECGSKL